MGKRKRTPTHGTAGTPGTEALQRLIAFFSDDRTEIHGQNATMGHHGAEAARTALEYLAAGDAENAVLAAMRAMEVCHDIQRFAAGREAGDDMRHVAECKETEKVAAVKLEAAWVGASKVCPDKGVPLKTAKAFCAKNKIGWRKPSRQRLEIHASDWANFWAGKDAERFGRLDQGNNTPSIFGNEDIVLDAAASLKQLQAKRRAGK